MQLVTADVIGTSTCTCICFSEQSLLSHIILWYIFRPYYYQEMISDNTCRALSPSVAILCARACWDIKVGSNLINYNYDNRY